MRGEAACPPQLQRRAASPRCYCRRGQPRPPELLTRRGWPVAGAARSCSMDWTLDDDFDEDDFATDDSDDDPEQEVRASVWRGALACPMLRAVPPLPESKPPRVPHAADTGASRPPPTRAGGRHAGH